MSNVTPQISRRDFIKIVAIAGGAGAALKFGLAHTGSPAVTTESRLLMGTMINLTLVGGEDSVARQAIVHTLDRMETLEQVLSRYIPESNVARLNRNGRLDNPNPALITVLDHANEMSVLTEGAFDITMKPLLDLYANSSLLPGQPEIVQTLDLVNYELLQIENNIVQLAAPGMSITLDGIAKGYIIDQGTEVLHEHGYTNILVEAGGDLSASGTKADQPWQIGIRSPRDGTDELLAHITVADQAIATSGDYLQTFSPDHVHHHIIDPRTGYSSTQLASATVLAPSAVQADGFATTLMVMNSQEGLTLIEELTGIEAYLVTKELEIFCTSGFPSDFRS